MNNVPPPRVRPRPLSLRVTPRLVPFGQDASVHVRIEPDPRNRSLEIEWRSAQGGGGWHVFPIDADRGATRYQYSIRRLAPGDYEIGAIVRRIDGTSTRRATTVTVLER